MHTPAIRLPAAECFARVRTGAAVLADVREPSEWTSGVAHLAALLPLSDLVGDRAHWKPFLQAQRTAKREILVYCAAGARSNQVAQTLANEGFRAANVGSLREWAAAGWQIVPPTP
ncbi:MAG: hypothetical protein B9S34_15020 [Opitutia bacterium Tous-C1TDCM]|nr:MAG: hypothetical protein B9S34_15020 [Opitutae bacterium Tous-C1TDCM]